MWMKSAGGVAQAAAQLRFAHRLALEGRAQYYAFGKATMPGTTNFGSVDYDPSGAAAMAGIGFVF